MSRPKPDMVVLFTDPLVNLQGRLCYWQKPQSGGRVIVEHLQQDAVGDPAWGPAGGGMHLEYIQAHLLMHVFIRGGAGRGGQNADGVVMIDLRDVKIPAAPV